jgi:hypothetical protein
MAGTLFLARRARRKGEKDGKERWEEEGKGKSRKNGGEK